MLNYDVANHIDDYALPVDLFNFSLLSNFAMRLIQHLTPPGAQLQCAQPYRRPRDSCSTCATSALSYFLFTPLPQVLNYDVPNHIEDYVHRVGRTGRAGACSLLCFQNACAASLRHPS